MHIEQIENAALGEKYYSVDHDSGLKLLIYPKKSYTTSYAVFGTKYGSIDISFMLEGESTPTVIPAGTAHFLEHKLFESEERDAFERFAETGASANAYTSFDKTCYLFSCSKNFAKSFEILLDFVQAPYFTEKTVQKEQGIIGQEIRMYDDEPDWRALFNMLKCMYSEHPVREDIAGTPESISTITADTLYRCYDVFYNLSNMVLTVTGNVEVDEVIRLADAFIKQPAAARRVKRIFNPEPRTVSQHEIREKMAVASPSFCLGYKEVARDTPPTLREKAQMAVLLELIIGETSPLYEKLLNSGLINPGFSFEYFCGPGYAAPVFQGESHDPAEVKRLIEAEIFNLKTHPLDENNFERVRKMLYGRELMGYNSVEATANALVAAYFDGFSLFDGLEIYRSLTVDEIEKRLITAFDTESSVLSVIEPV